MLLVAYGPRAQRVTMARISEIGICASVASMTLPGLEAPPLVAPFKVQLLKWIGNKQRMAHLIANVLPVDLRAYHEPFLGSGAVLGTLAPQRGFGSDALAPLMEIWQALADDPGLVKQWYSSRAAGWTPDSRLEIYERVRQ